MWCSGDSRTFDKRFLLVTLFLPTLLPLIPVSALENDNLYHIKIGVFYETFKTGTNPDLAGFKKERHLKVYLEIESCLKINLAISYRVQCHYSDAMKQFKVLETDH